MREEVEDTVLGECSDEDHAVPEEVSDGREKSEIDLEVESFGEPISLRAVDATLHVTRAIAGHGDPHPAAE